MPQIQIIDALAVPLDRENVDTDAIIPKQFLKSTARTGYGENLFDAWRYLDAGEPGQPHVQRRLHPDFVLNQPRYRGAGILLARDNFGCGSSREHASWALLQYGIQAIIASGFGDIFRNNALKNGLIVVQLGRAEIDRLFREVQVQPGYRLQVDLTAQRVRSQDGGEWAFEIDPFRRRCLLEGVDELTLALSAAADIRAWERSAAAQHPWNAAGIGPHTGDTA